MSMDQQPPADDNDFGLKPGAETQGSSGPSQAENAITPLTICRFLIGREAAIEAVAQSRGCLWLGLGFVLLAGFFREYDQESLLYEPWHFFIPLGASLALCVLLFVIMAGLSQSDDRPSRREQFRQLLTCLWMMAPMAVIYAIPVERFNSAGAATRWNLWFLGFVSVWRVALISRVLSVLCNSTWFKALFPIMLLADTLAIIFSMAIPLPLLQIMGGVHLTESQLVINSVRATIILLGVVSWLIWLAGTSCVAWNPQMQSVRLKQPANAPVNRGCWGIILFAAVVMIGACFVTQPEQTLRARAERLLNRGHSTEGIAYLSQFRQADFPPHWDPPPRIISTSRCGEAFKHLGAALNSPETPPWITEAFARKIVQIRGHGLHWYPGFFSAMTNADLEILASLMEVAPEWKEPLQIQDDTLARFVNQALHDTDPNSLERYPHGQLEPRPVHLLQRLLNLSISPDRGISIAEVQQKLTARQAREDAGLDPLKESQIQATPPNSLSAENPAKIDENVNTP